MVKKSKVTIEKLAQMTQNEFSRVYDRFDTIDARFNGVDDRFDAMDKRFDKMDSTLKTILDVVLEIPSKKAFERLENKVGAIDVRLASVERKVR